MQYLYIFAIIGHFHSFQFLIIINKSTVSILYILDNLEMLIMLQFQPQACWSFAYCPQIKEDIKP